MVWKKGQSGNPTGRQPNNKGFRKEFIERATESGLVLKALRVLETALGGKQRLEASKYLLDQTIGKPQQAVAVEGGLGIDYTIRIKR